MNQESFKRKLSAILSADAVGYSRLMGDDDEATVRTLTAFRTAVSDLVQQFRGRIVDNPGDNILAEFTSVVDAVNCSVEIQRELAERNAELPENRRMLFRIGVNLGDVIEEDGRIYGDGVNIAARVESLAEPEGICLSGRVYDQVANRLGLEYENLGKHQVKNIDVPIRVYRVLSYPGAAAHRTVKVRKTVRQSRRKKMLFVAACLILVMGISGGIIWHFSFSPNQAEIALKDTQDLELPQGPSLAVLPFDNMSGDPDQEYVCDGFTESLISILSYHPDFLVIARNSSFVYKEKSVDVRQVGRELGVQYVLEGSIQKAEERIRLTAQLIDAESGNHLWSERYHGDLEDIFSLQDKITIRIATSLQSAFGMEKKIGKKQARSFYESINNFEILSQTWQAVRELSRWNKEGNALAREKAKELIKIAPDITGGYTILGWTYFFDVWLGTNISDAHTCLKKAAAAAQKAITIDDKTAIPHLLLSNIYLMFREHEKAVSEGRLAIKLNPNFADAYAGLCFVFTNCDRPVEAVRLCKKALRLNPLSPALYLNHLGLAYLDSGQFEQAVDILKKSIEKKPNGLFNRLNLIIAYIALGQEEKARRHALKILEIDPEFSVESYVQVIPHKNQENLKIAAEALRMAGLQ